MLLHFVRHYLLAIQFFTRLPVTGRLADWVGYSPVMLRASAAHLPGVGWVVGAIAAGVLALALWALPAVPAAPWVAAVLCTVSSVWVTGGFHEDGLADLSDGLGGSYQRERALEIMKDSRIGAFGAMALVLALVGKCALLATLVEVNFSLAVLSVWAAHITSRLFPLLTIRTLPHVGDTAQSKSKPLADVISAWGVWGGLVWWTIAMLGVVHIWPTYLWAGGAGGAFVAWVWMRRLLAHRLQGFTGDGLGATQQICELAFYLGIAVAAAHSDTGI